MLVGGAVYLGLVYGWIAHRTHTIRSTIVAHFLVNAMASASPPSSFRPDHNFDFDPKGW